MTVLLIFLLNYFLAINAFNPISTTSSSSNGATHEAITRCAFATVTCEYIKTQFGIEIPIPTITNGICPSSFFTQINAAFAQITAQGGNTYSSWENTVNYIIARNAIVDVVEQTDESRHFDSESFISASQIILERYQLAIHALNLSNYEDANEYFGKMTHTLQDFYSHSNWIELNNREPQLDLGINTMTSSQFAAPTVRTCTNCLTGTTAICQSNNDISKGLTSGYFILLADVIHKKPVGKCSHGGTFDATKNNDAIGGINKDTPNSIHGYLHEPAAQTAYLATCKILRQFRTQVLDSAFGKFLNILNRKGTSTQSFSFVASLKSIIDPALVYTRVLTDIRTANSFTFLQEIVSLPAIDSNYKSHILSLATQKHITIDIFRNSMFRQNIFDFGQDLARSTGGLYVYYYNKSEANISIHTNDQVELIDFLYAKDSSNNILIPVDNTCSDLILELVINDTIPSLTIQLQNSNQLISPSSVDNNMTYYRSYLFSKISSGKWKLIFSSSVKFTFDLRVSCYSQFRCFSRLYVNNDNSVHPGLVELEGNLIENQNAFFITTCDNSNNITIADMAVTMVDEINGNILGNSFPLVHDSENDRWVTNLTNIPSTAFRLKYLINNQQIQRLTRRLYQPSSINVEIILVNTTSKNQIIVKYRLYNYSLNTIKMKFAAKNIGTYSDKKDYTLKAHETRDDQIEFDPKTKATDMTSNMLTLTVTTSDGNWNYDVISL